MDASNQPVAPSGAPQNRPALPERARKPFALFIAAMVVTFANITLLSFVRPPLFFVFLVLMHGGIALFIVSRHMCKSQGMEAQTKPIYLKEYALLIPYLLFMAWSLLARAGVLPDGGDAKVALVLGWTFLCLVWSIANAAHLHRAMCEALAS